MKTLSIVFSILIILIIDNIDATAVNVAIPTLIQAFKTSLAHASWIINIYLSTSAAFFLMSGYLGRIFGLKKIMILGIILIGVASILVGTSNNLSLLLIGRFIQGAGYAFTFTMIFLILKQHVPEKQQKFVIGLLTTFVAVSSTAGPLIGGAFLHYLSWRWIFLINIPLCLLCLLFLSTSMEEVFEPEIVNFKEITALSLLMLMIFFLVLTIFYSMNDFKLFGLNLMLFSIFFSSFLLYEKKYQTEVINLRDFLVKSFSLVIFDRFVMQIVSFGFFISVPLFLEKIENASSTTTGLFLSIMTLSTAVVSFLMGLLYKNKEAWIAIIFGFLVLITACIFWWVFLLYSNNIFLVLSYIIFGIAFGILYPQVNIEFMKSLSEVKDRNMSSGLFYASSLIFGVIGVCVTTAILNNTSNTLTKCSYIHLIIAWIILAIFGVVSRSIKRT